MPLRDHFRPPLDDMRHWEGFHATWPVMIVALLRRKLPRRYFAGPRVHPGSSAEIDVATFHDEGEDVLAVADPNENGGGIATAVWAPPRPTLAVVTDLPAQDVYEVRVYDEKRHSRLVAAVEIVSPANKDRPEARRTFAAKCAAYLQRGIGLVIVDFVTERRANLHNELVDLLGPGEAFRFPHDSLLYTTAYHPVRRDDREEIDWWAQPLVVGQPMPTIPLPVRGLAILPLDLEAAYTDARRLSRLG